MRTLILSLLLLVDLTAQAATLGFPALPGGGLVYKQVQSIRARRFADLVAQKTQGFSMLDMKRYVESMGMRARGYRIEAAQLEQLKIPAIVLMEIRGYKHFVVLQRTQGEYVYVGDPALGHKRYALTEFAKGWNGIVFAVIGQGYDRGNPLLTPPEPLTARNRLDRFKPVRDAELMEFGFIQSDFF
ncbi:peptidase C39 [Pseudomonas aeruginosa]|nr:peptidase C39 [Pseudomonas aeruginosa]